MQNRRHRFIRGSPSGADSRAGSAKKSVGRRRRRDRRWAKALRADLPGVPRRKCGRRGSGSFAVNRRFSAWRFGQRSVPEHSLRNCQHADVAFSSAHFGSSVATGELFPQLDGYRCGGESVDRGRHSRRRKSLLRQSRLRDVSRGEQPRRSVRSGSYPTPEESRPIRCVERSSSPMRTLIPVAARRPQHPGGKDQGRP